MWSVHYGCEEWQSQEELTTETEALDRFRHLADNWTEMSMGLYPAAYLSIRNPLGELERSIERRYNE